MKSIFQCSLLSPGHILALPTRIPPLKVLSRKIPRRDSSSSFPPAKGTYWLAALSAVRGKLRRSKACLIDVLWEEQILILEDKRRDVKGEQR